MSLTRKDFDDLAARTAAQLQYLTDQDYDNSNDERAIVYTFGTIILDFLASQNPNFDRDRFVEAADLNGTKRYSGFTF